MKATPKRINMMRTVTAMVALDTVDLLATRVVNLLAAGRRMTVFRRYTHGGSPEVTAGLTLFEPPNRWCRHGAAGLGVKLQPGLTAGFGFSAYPGESATEAETWRRFHANNDRRDMTQIEITGGMPGDGPARDDQLIIRHWNRHGVCEEVIVAFDYDTRNGAVIDE